MNLSDAQIAVLAENQYQELELWYPVLRLREAGENIRAKRGGDAIIIELDKGEALPRAHLKDPSPAAGR